jgi:hypothetical protein
MDEDWPPRPDPWLFESGNWLAVQQALGTLLPTDYTEIIGEGIACVFGGELTILSPFDPNPNCNLFRAGAENIWAVAYFRRAGWPEHTVPLYPEPGGLLSWGRDNNGAQYFWDTASGDPETWTMVVDGRPVDPPCSATRSASAAISTLFAQGPSRPLPTATGRRPTLALSVGPSSDIHQRY